MKTFKIPVTKEQKAIVKELLTSAQTDDLETYLKKADKLYNFSEG